MYDATELCDNVAFIVDGKIKALDSPRNLIMSKGASKVCYTYLANGKEASSATPLGNTSADTTLIRLIREKPAFNDTLRRADAERYFCRYHREAAAMRRRR
jgi:ABC-type multidrug transport system ATPase subunit